MKTPLSMTRYAINVLMLMLGGSLLATEAQANAGFGVYTNKVGVDVTVQTYYANSPMGLHDVTACYTAAGVPTTPVPGGACDTGAALAKFVDKLPLVALPGNQPIPYAGAGNNKYFSGATGTVSTGPTGKYIPVAIPTKWLDPNTNLATGDDYYEIAVVEYKHRFHTNLTNETLTRGYVQIDPAATDAAAGLNNGATPIPGSLAVRLVNPITGQNIQIPRLDSNATIGNIPAGDILGDDGRPYKMVDAIAVDNPHYLGPVITASRNIPTRVKFINLLPVGRASGSARNGDIFLPVDETLPGAGFGPDGKVKYTQNRAEIHLHGGDNPWISDGTAHQWITPAGEANDAAGVYAEALGKGVVAAEAKHYLRGWGAINVPDMPNPGPGAMTYYFPNGESARMEWYHDHSFGLTRLNVYAGMVSAYLLDDPTDTLEKSYKQSGVIPEEEIPLVFQDKTFVSKDIAVEDGRWDTVLWGGESNLWYPHVYEMNQNATNSADLTYAPGRWDWGPYFWPVFPSFYDRLPNGSHALMQNTVKGAVVSTGLTEVTVTPEAFVDTPLVNGQAYPTLTVDPKAYRFRMLNGLNDRYLNLGLYVAADKLTTDALAPNDPTKQPVVCDGRSVRPDNSKPALTDCTEVKMVNFDTSYPGQYYPNGLPNKPFGANGQFSFPTSGGLNGTGWGSYYGQIATNAGVPDPATAGPDIYQIGNETGYLARAVTIPSTAMNYETSLQSITVLNILERGLLLNPAGRADVVIDFSKYAGQTLIFYNDARAPLPAGDPRIDYFTGMGDFSGVGGNENVVPGYGPNSRTVMQIYVKGPNDTVNPVNPAPEYDPTPLPAAISALFVKNQPKPIVPEPAFAALYPDDTAFSSLVKENSAGVNIGSLCQAGNSCAHLGYQGFTFTTSQPITYTKVPTTCTDLTSCRAAEVKVTLPAGGLVDNAKIEKKAIQELFEPTFGRMNATLGVELPYTAALTATTIPLTYVDPTTEKIPEGETQFWRITHNGVDAHPMHFHLVNVQVINRVGWDGAIKLPLADEHGWKETVVMHPLEDVIVAVQAKAPKLPFGLPDSVRPRDPSQPIGAGGSAAAQANGALVMMMQGFTQVDPITGNPKVVQNQMDNYGWEHTWHCHILGHEENDFMRPFVIDYWNNKSGKVAGIFTNLPAAPINLTLASSNKVTWTDPTPPSDPLTYGPNPKNEIGYILTRTDETEKALVSAASYVPATFNVIANATSWTAPDIMAEGHSYTFVVAAYNQLGVGPSASVTGSVPVTVSAPTLNNIANANVTANSVSLSWTSGGGAGTKYFVQYKSPTSDWVTLPPVTGLTYTVTGLLPNTAYSFRVGSTSNNGVSMAVSTIKTGTTDAIAAVVTAAVTATSANVQWTLAGGGTATLVVTNATTNAVAGTLGTATATGRPVTGLVANTSYNFTVNVTGANSKVISTMLTKATNTTPATFGVTPVTAITSTTATVTWANPVVAGAPTTSVTIAPTTGGASIAAATATTANATSLTPNTRYTVTVNKIGLNGVAVPATTTFTTVPGQVSNVALNMVGTTGTLSWTAPVGGGTVAVTVSPVGTTRATVTNNTATVTGMVSGTTYTFTLKVGTGTAVTFTAVALAAPTAVTAKLTSATSAVFNYTAPAGVTKFGVQQLIGTVWTNLTSVNTLVGTAGTSTVTTGLTLTSGGTYSFRIVSLNATNLVGSASATATISLAAVPTVATGLVAVGGTALSATINLSWASGNNVASALIYRSVQVVTTVAGVRRVTWSAPALIATVSGVNTYQNTGLVRGSVYSYQIVLQNAAGSSAATASFPAAGVTAP